MNCDEILYTPLDVAPQPYYDITELKNWIIDSHNTEERQSIRKNLSDSKLTAESYIDQQNYPWKITPVYNTLYGNGPGWINNFDKAFPELAKYFYEAYGIPFEEVGSITMLPLKDDYTGFGFWHNDVDGSGIRLYLEYPQEHHKLFMKKTIEPYTIDFKRGLKRFTDEHLQSEIHECRVLHSKQAFYLNNWRSSHATYNTVPGLTRIATFIAPKYNNGERFHSYVKDLIVRSATKYKDYAIIW